MSFRWAPGEKVRPRISTATRQWEQLFRFPNSSYLWQTTDLRLNRNEIDAAAKSLFDAVAQGVVASNVAKTFPLREAAAAHTFIGGRKTTGSIVMLPFE